MGACCGKQPGNEIHEIDSYVAVKPRRGDANCDNQLTSQISTEVAESNLNNNNTVISTITTAPCNVQQNTSTFTSDGNKIWRVDATVAGTPADENEHTPIRATEAKCAIAGHSFHESNFSSNATKSPTIQIPTPTSLRHCDVNDSVPETPVDRERIRPLATPCRLVLYSNGAHIENLEEMVDENTGRLKKQYSRNRDMWLEQVHSNGL